jgi:hypothetical protein
MDIDGGLRQGVRNVGEGKGCAEYITQTHGKFREIKAASGWRLALETGSGFGSFSPGLWIWGKLRENPCLLYEERLGYSSLSFHSLVNLARFTQEQATW